MLWVGVATGIVAITAYLVPGLDLGVYASIVGVVVAVGLIVVLVQSFGYLRELTGDGTDARAGALVTLLLAAGGIAIGIWMGIKGHDYYYPGRLGFDLREEQSSFEARDVGRYELDYKQELGDLTFEVVSETGEQVAVREFAVLTRLFHTMGRQGHAFRVDKAGTYRVSVRPWSTGAKVHLSYQDTQAIARWSFGGMLLLGLSGGLAALALLSIVRSRKTACSESSEAAEEEGG